MKIMGRGGFAGAGLGESFSTYICPMIASDVELVALSYFTLLGTRKTSRERDLP
jgi:hypothetical protein